MGATGHGLWHFLPRDEYLSNGRRGETIHVLQHHMPLGLAEIRAGCNSGLANPFDAGGVACGIFHILVYMMSRKLKLQGGMWLLENFHIHRFKKNCTFLDIIAKRIA